MTAPPRDRPPLWMTLREQGGWWVVSLVGPVDVAALGRGVDRLFSLPQPPTGLIVDVNDMVLSDALLDSALLVDSTVRLNRGIKLVVVCDRPRLLRWFQSAAPQIRVVASVEDALAPGPP